MKKALTFIFLFVFSVLQAQLCDTINEKHSKHVGIEYEKQKDRGREGKAMNITDPEILYDIATYRRQKNDTNSNYWYKKALEGFKKEGELKSAKKQKERLYKLGLSYFYLGNYAEAEAYFAKAIAAKYYNCCEYYFYSFSLRKQGKTKEAEGQFKLFEQAAKPHQRD